jgi:hypothetical protein
MSDAKEIKSMLLQRVSDVCAHLLPDGVERGGEWLVGSVSGERGKSLRVRLTGHNAGVWLDHASSDKGDIITLWQSARGIDFKEAIREIRAYLNLPDEEEERAGRSATWKRVQAEMGTGTIHDVEELASLRKLPTTDGLVAAIESSHLFFGPVSDGPEGGPYSNHHSWIITDSSRLSGQARRMDGVAWANDKKAKTLIGTTGKWPIGISESTLPEIALVEGGPDFLAAYTAVAMLGVLDRIQPVTMLGSSQPIFPKAVPLFANKTVWMFPHSDENYAGLQGAIKWGMQLSETGATIIPFDFSPYPEVKDLNDFIAALSPVHGGAA